MNPATESSKGPGWSGELRPPQAFAAYPLAQLASAFALGILLAAYVKFSLSVLVVFGALATVSLLVAFVWNELGKPGIRQVLRTTVILLVVALLGSTLESIEQNHSSTSQLKTLLQTGTVVVGEPAELTGVLEREPEYARGCLYLQLRLERIRSRAIGPSEQSSKHESVEPGASGVVVLFAPITSAKSQQEYGELDLRYGARIRVMTLLERADSFRNPGVSSFTEYLDRKGYDATGFVKSPLLIERLENERVFLPVAWLYEWRRKLQREIDSLFNPDTAGVLDAAFLGNRYNLSRSTSERFRDGGTFHVLVISGLHITFLGGMVFLIARRLTRKAWLRFGVSVSVLWAYSIAVGAESSVVRAALMFTVVLLGPLVSRRASSLNALGGAAMILLVRRPDDLFDPSFQLTFISVLAMVVCAWPLMEKLSQIGSWRPSRTTPYPPSCPPWLRTFCESLFWSERRAKVEMERANFHCKLFKAPMAASLERFHLQRPLRYAFGAVVVSAAVQLMLLPFLVVYFHRLSIASVVLNIGVSLLMGVLAISATLALLVAQLNLAMAAPLISATNGLNWLMVHSVDPFARLGVSSMRLPEYSGELRLIYVLYYLPLGTLLVFLGRWRPLELTGQSTKSRALVALLPAQILAIGLIVIHPFSAGAPTGRLRVDFLDVGQGDSALVTFPDNSTLLIDGGGRPGPFQRNKATDGAAPVSEETFERETKSIGEAVVSEYLWWRGLDYVDFILATHADADHIDGLNDVARNFKVDLALVARTPLADEEYIAFGKTLTNEGVPVQLIGAGDVLRFGEVSATVLWPPASADPNYPSRNNDSIVLSIRFGASTILLTGDVETAGEQGILRTNENLRADLVKVAHHGSKTSSTQSFIAATQPRFAVISVGQTSIFGHPNAEVVKRWNDSGAHVLTTGSSGMITIITDGRDLRLESFVK